MNEEEKRRMDGLNERKERLEHRARGETVKEEIEEEVVQRGGGWLDG